MIPLVIVPFHDATWLPNVEANLCRQTIEARVVFAINGKAKDFESARWQTTPSGNSHADAVNAGVAWARDGRDFTHAVCLDSDDYYGPEYLAKALKALESGDFTGKRTIYTWLSDGLYLFKRPHFMGGTLGFSIEKFQPMRAVHQDDHDWHERMLASGACESETGPSEYCYVRHGANAHWQANDVIARRAMGEGLFFPLGKVEHVSGNPGPFRISEVPTDAQVFEAM